MIDSGLQEASPPSPSPPAYSLYHCGLVSYLSFSCVIFYLLPISKLSCKTQPGTNLQAPSFQLFWTRCQHFFSFSKRSLKFGKTWIQAKCEILYLPYLRKLSESKPFLPLDQRKNLINLGLWDWLYRSAIPPHMRRMGAVASILLYGWVIFFLIKGGFPPYSSYFTLFYRQIFCLFVVVLVFFSSTMIMAVTEFGGFHNGCVPSTAAQKCLIYFKWHWCNTNISLFLWFLCAPPRKSKLTRIVAVCFFLFALTELKNNICIMFPTRCRQHCVLFLPILDAIIFFSFKNLTLPKKC